MQVILKKKKKKKEKLKIIFYYLTFNRYLSGNQIKEIPSEIKNLTSLRYLYVKIIIYLY